jgi:uncharacterized protein YegP (UPF0339 family)
MLKIHILQDKDHQWRWRIRARNGQIVAGCEEGYKHKNKCENSMFKVVNSIKAGDYEVVKDSNEF